MCRASADDREYYADRVLQTGYIGLDGKRYGTDQYGAMLAAAGRRITRLGVI